MIHKEKIPIDPMQKTTCYFIKISIFYAHWKIPSEKAIFNHKMAKIVVSAS